MAKSSLFNSPEYNIVLQQLAELEWLPQDLGDFDLERFSHDKSLFDYQQEALANGLRALFAYYDGASHSKENFYCYYRKYNHTNLDFIKPTPLLAQYYPLTGKRIEFYHFVNRMSFWMTMGSGKTIVIIKLIELLDKAMGMGLIPAKPIMFFTANQGLLDRFKQEIELYNDLKTGKIIENHSLKRYEDVLNAPRLGFHPSINIFSYRADLMGEDGKENILDYKDYLNDGNHYVILDEAHKGNKDDSKRQHIFSILSQNGFLFNFSATFTDKRDLATTVYNLNQAVWIKKGYGKKLFLLDNDLKAFKDKKSLNDAEKQKALIKSLILLAFSKKYKQAVGDAYYNPMMVVFTNSVNIQGADAELFFNQIQLLFSQSQQEGQRRFDLAKDEISTEFKKTRYLISDSDGETIHEFADAIKGLNFDEMKQAVFHQKNGNIEAIINPKDNSEIAFKLDTADKIFGLLKIGDIKSWKKDKLANIKITDTYKSAEESHFKALDRSDINILIGSRSFYEGWDTNRPNIMLFLNIGMNEEAKKFITQSIGRGMRINSVDGSRQRLSFIDSQHKAAMAENVKPLESLFIISTNKDAIEHILKWQGELETNSDWHEISLAKNPIESHQILYIPQYKKQRQKIFAINQSQNFKLSQRNLDALEALLKHMDSALFTLMFNFYDQQEYDILHKMVIDNPRAFYVDDAIHYESMDILIDKLKKRLYVSQSHIDGFKVLSDEIVHFKKIKVLREKREDLESSIKDAMDGYKVKLNQAEFLTLAEHYYSPIITDKNSEWLKNIISVPSEIDFVEELLTFADDLNDKYDWWKFSKLNEYHDTDIHIPYTEGGTEKKFHPDFIFWLQKGSKQTILFADPKGIRHTQHEHKIDGFAKIFKKDDMPRKFFTKNDMQVEVILSLYNISDGTVGEKYLDYWVNKGSLKSLFIKDNEQ